MLFPLFHTVLRLWYLKQYVSCPFLNWILNIQTHSFHCPSCSLYFSIFFYIIPCHRYSQNVFSVLCGPFISPHILSLKRGTWLVLLKSLISLVRSRVGSQCIVRRGHGWDILFCSVKAWRCRVQSRRKKFTPSLPIFLSLFNKFGPVNNWYRDYSGSRSSHLSVSLLPSFYFFFHLIEIRRIGVFPRRKAVLSSFSCSPLQSSKVFWHVGLRCRHWGK